MFAPSATPESQRFQRLRMLGRGSFGEVWEAVDRRHDTRVAVKVLSRLGSASLLGFKHEFRGLVHLAHPNLVELYELVSDGTTWSLVMELINGDDFIDWLRPIDGARGLLRDQATMTDATLTDATIDDKISPMRDSGGLDLHRLRSSLPQMTRAVTYLHGAGIVHRDLKPSNVLVNSEGRVVVLDFGLIADADDSEGPAGTPAYMAPEVLLGQPATPASDWYSMGVMLYMALTGERPFATRAEAELGDAAPDPRLPALGIPNDLAELCVDLMHPEAAMRPDGDEVWARLGMRGRNSGVSRRPARNTLIGREHHLDVLNSALEEASNAAVAVGISGVSGMGKSALAEAFLSTASVRCPDLLVLRTACYDRETVPYKAVDGIVDALARYMANMHPRQLFELVPPSLTATASVFPVLAPFAPGYGPVVPADAQERRRLAFRGLRELLVGLSLRQRLVLFVEDLQWGDLDSATLLRWVVRPPDAPRMLMVATWCSENASDHPVIGHWLGMSHDAVPVHEVRVGPLSSEDAEQMALTIAADSVAMRERAAFIAQESGGSPFFVSELVRYAEEEAAGTTIIAPTHETRHTSLAQVLEFRLSSLPASARTIVEVLAVAGQPVEWDMVKAAAECTLDSQHTLRLLQQRSMVRVERVGSLQQVALRHDQMRRAVLEAMPERRLAAHHMHLARVYEAHPAPNVETLMSHYQQAGHQARASLLAVAAARTAAREQDFERAQRLYRYALRHGSPTPAGARSMQCALGDVLSAAGSGAAAAEAYLEAARDAAPFERLTRKYLAAAQLLMVGHLDRGEALAEEVLAELRLPALVRGSGAARELRWVRVKLAMTGMRVNQRAEPAPAEALLRVDVCLTLGSTFSVVDPLLAAVWQARALLEALDAGEPVRLAVALAREVAERALRKGEYDSAAHAMHGNAEFLAKESGSDLAQSQCTLTKARVALASGHWEDGISAAADVVHRLRARGASSDCEVATGELTRLLGLLWSARWREARALSVRLSEDAEQRGDRHIMIIASLGRAMALQLPEGDVAGVEQALATAMAVWGSDGFDLPHWWAAYVRGECDLYRGEPRAAIRRLEAIWPNLKATLVHMGMVEVLARDQRGRALLQAWPGLTARDQRSAKSTIKSDINSLGKLGPFGVLCSERLRAGMVLVRDGAPAGAAAYARVADLLQAGGVHAWSLACKRRAALLSGDQGTAAQTWEQLHNLGVTDVDRTTDRLAPGSGSG